MTPFTARYTANTTGEVAIVGNTVLTCPPGAGGCAAVLAGADGRNNDFTMTYVDIDGDPATFASSSADLSVPAGAQVLFAGLYWGGRSGAGGGGAAAPNAGIRETVKLKVPGAGAYATVTGAETGDVADGANAYQAFADVTAQVTAAGGGTYTVADVQASTGSDAYGGWSLVVAYRDASSPLRNLAVFDGFEVVRNQPGDQSKSITVTGLFAPPAGVVKAKVGVIAYDGDRGSTGDTLTLNGSPVSDGLHPVSDVFNSTFADRGTRFAAKAPDHANSLGMDASIFAADGLVASGATSATIDLTTGGETYYPGVVTSVIDLYAPQLVVSKSATDVNGGALVAGDVLQYAVTVRNEGADAASAVVLTDTAPAGTSVVPGSLAITAGDGPGALSDASGDDRGDVATGTIAARLGAGRDRGGRRQPRGRGLDHRDLPREARRIDPGRHLARQHGAGRAHRRHRGRRPRGEKQHGHLGRRRARSGRREGASGDLDRGPTSADGRRDRLLPGGRAIPRSGHGDGRAPAHPDPARPRGAFAAEGLPRQPRGDHRPCDEHAQGLPPDDRPRPRRRVDPAALGRPQGVGRRGVRDAGPVADAGARGADPEARAGGHRLGARSEVASSPANLREEDADQPRYRECRGCRGRRLAMGPRPVGPAKPGRAGEPRT